MTDKKWNRLTSDIYCFADDLGKALGDMDEDERREVCTIVGLDYDEIIDAAINDEGFDPLPFVAKRLFQTTLGIDPADSEQPWIEGTEVEDYADSASLVASGIEFDSVANGDEDEEFDGLTLCPECAGDLATTELNTPAGESDRYEGICEKCGKIWRWDDEGYTEPEGTCTECGKPITGIAREHNGGMYCDECEERLFPEVDGHNHLHCPQCGADDKSKQWRFVAAPGGGLWACECGAMWRDWDKATKEQTPPFETIIDEHDGRLDLRATITMPNGFMVEVAIENVDGTPDVALYAGMPDDPNSLIPGDLIGRWDVARLLE
jgi:hypothetical protein